MRLTTDANDSVTLSDIIKGHRTSLQDRLAQAESTGKADLAGRLKEQLQRLDAQESKIRQEVS